MITVSSINYISPTPCVVALGCFDGVHLGHEAVIRRARDVADKHALPLSVWSFQTPPKNFFSPTPAPLLSTEKEKEARMRALGVDIFLSIPFDASVAAIPYEVFFEEILVGRLKAQHLVCGFDFTFGKNGLGNAERLAALCATHGMTLSVVPPFSLDSDTVSASGIREAIEAGALEQAGRMLGYDYSITGEVVHGQHLARDLGFRTINQLLDQKKAVPRHGVYVTRIEIGDTKYYGISNVGMRPTVGGTLLCAETHIFDFSGDLYGTHPTVAFLHFLRPEVKFDSLATLTNQIQADIISAKDWLKSNQ